MRLKERASQTVAIVTKITDIMDWPKLKYHKNLKLSAWVSIVLTTEYESHCKNEMVQMAIMIDLTFFLDFSEGKTPSSTKDVTCAVKDCVYQANNIQIV